MRRIVFFAGPGWERWSPATIDETGAGGSETALVRLAAALARRGWTVTVFSDVYEGIVDGVAYRAYTSWTGEEPADVFVSSRLPSVFERDIAAPVRVLWCHDANYGDELTPERAEAMTDVVALSHWHRDHLAERYPFLEEKLCVLRNGIALETDDGAPRFPAAQRPFAERRPACLYTSSPHRGLDVLLELWPSIRERVPDAELHVYYGWDIYDRIAETRPDLRALKVLLFHLYDLAGGEAGGITMHGRVSQLQLHRAMQEARCWSYPTAFYETSCIGAMEARAAGLPIVTSDLGGLTETVGEHGILVAFERQPADDEPSGNRWSGYREAFVDNVVRLLADGAFWTEWQQRGLDGVDALEWSARAGDWESLLGARAAS